jgi:acetyl esterase
VPLDPQARALLDELPDTGAIDFAALPVAALRRGWEGLALRGAGEPVARVEERSIAGPGGALRLRIYRPAAAEALPVLVYLHGGGFVTGSLDTHDALCRSLANRVPCCVASVDYRLAPEHRFPAAPEDCHAALCWAEAHADELDADAGCIAVGGDSAGGNLAAVSALLCRERGGPRLRHQLLLYPVIAPDFETPSYRQCREGFFLSRNAMMAFWGHYLAREADRLDPIAVPLCARDLSGLPPATVVTAEYDPLRDEGEAYAERLREAGVPAELLRYDGQIHGFLNFAHRVDRARQALDDVAGRLRAAFGG